MSDPMNLRPMIPVCLCLLLAACGDRGDAGTNANGDQASATTLPAPQGTHGSVTGMPDTPGPGQVGPPVDDASDVTIDSAEDAQPTDADEGDASSSPADAGEPTPQDAVAIIRDYYASINARNFSHAFALWSDGGNASGQTPQQFADGFADTAGVSATIDVPGRVDAAAGSRYIEIPVAITAEQRDGGTRRFVGAYTLRRSVVDGATAEQRAWRITSADIREVAVPR